MGNLIFNFWVLQISYVGDETESLLRVTVLGSVIVGFQKCNSWVSFSSCFSRRVYCKNESDSEWCLVNQKRFGQFQKWTGIDTTWLNDEDLESISIDLIYVSI